MKDLSEILKELGVCLERRLLDEFQAGWEARSQAREEQYTKFLIAVDRLLEVTGDGDNGPPLHVADAWENVKELLIKLEGKK